MINTLATIILIIICFCIAPFMTIAVIFAYAEWGIFGKILFVIFSFIGIVHTLYKINNRQ